MRHLSIAGIFGLLLVGPALAGERCAALDGGTVQCGRERVKIEGISVTAGKDARERLQRRLQGGEVVIERRGTDKYGRTLGRLFVGGQRITQADLSATR
jgi:endonuclease YncB( thermonuclease family)